jgi:hypothetical protein
MSNTNPLPTHISALIVSVIRTVVPTVWGSALAWLLLQWPALALVSDQFTLFGELLTVALIAGWYALWRKIETRLPVWLRTAALGAAVAPTVYAPQPDSVVAVEVTKSPDQYGQVTRTFDVSGDNEGTVLK